MDWSDLPRENYHGCVEYKWRLGLEHNLKINQLATQMKFRLGEGDGTAFYLLGVRDSGVALGLTPGEHAAAVRILMGVASLMGNVLLLEAFSDRRHGGKRCSAWRVQSRGLALKEVKD